MANRQMKHYTLKVTAGPSRDSKLQEPVPVNSEKPLHFDTDHLSTDVYVRVQNFRSSDSSPSTSPYFQTAPHENDQYSISFSPLKFKGDVKGDDLVLGNDFDEPISKSLPPGFSVAWRVARWVVDPGLEGDPWAEKPWLEGRALGSVNVVAVGQKKQAEVLTESLGSDVGDEIPTEAAARMKYFLTKANRDKFTFEKDKPYHLDFFNPYIDFNEFALKLPGVTMKILRYWDGQPLRYVLKNRVDQTVYMVVQFTLVPNDDAPDENAIADDGDEHSEDEIDEEHHVVKAAEEAHRQSESQGKSGGKVETSSDDVD